MKKTRLLISFSVIILALSVIAYGFSVIDANTNVTRVACIGDSITQGSGYPDRLQELLGSDYEVGNFGVDGSTVSQETAMPYMRQDKFIDAMEFKPDIVIIMLGTNDANPEINYN